METQEIQENSGEQVSYKLTWVDGVLETQTKQENSGEWVWLEGKTVRELNDEEDMLMTVLGHFIMEGKKEDADKVRSKIEEIRFELEELRRKAMADLMAKYGNTSEKE